MRGWFGNSTVRDLSKRVQVMHSYRTPNIWRDAKDYRRAVICWDWRGLRLAFAYFAIANMEPKIRLLRYTQGKQWNTKGRARGAEGEDEEEEEQESGMIQDRWGDLQVLFKC